MHGLQLYDVHSLFPHTLLEKKNQLCYGGALRAVHNVFCWWIKVEEAKYLAQIYAESLTLRTSHPRAKSPFPATSTERRVSEREKSEGGFKKERGLGGGNLSSVSEQHSAYRGGMGRHRGGEGGREGGKEVVSA